MLLDAGGRRWKPTWCTGEEADVEEGAPERRATSSSKSGAQITGHFAGITLAYFLEPFPECGLTSQVRFETIAWMLQRGVASQSMLEALA